MKSAPNVIRKSLALVVLLTWAGAPARLSGDTVEYEVTFIATWSRATHPQSFPPGPHFSGLIGGTHNDSLQFWELGEIATPGIENMAETGSKSPLTSEIQSAIAASDGFSLISGGGIGRSPGSISATFMASSTHPLVTLVSMIAPSPDWFVGVSALNLRPDDTWLSETTIDLVPYDAGTDSGANFTSSNSDTNPPEPITHITGFPFENAPPLGTFTLRRLVSLQPGDADQDLDFDQFDIIQVSQTAKYLTGQPATWGEGDWNGAPGGGPGDPPAGDGVFNQFDIIAAQQAALYLTGSYGARLPHAGARDSGISLGYYARSGETGLSEDFVFSDLRVDGSLAGGGDLGEVREVYVPEPGTIVCAVMGILGVLAFRQRSLTHSATGRDCYEICPRSITLAHG